MRTYKEGIGSALAHNHAIRAKKTTGTITWGEGGAGCAFDVTVGPLVNRWGFGPDGRPQAPPSGDELEALRAAVGQPLKLTVRAEAFRFTCGTASVW